MKRTIALILSVIMVMCFLTACGSSNQNTAAANTDNTDAAADTADNSVVLKLGHAHDSSSVYQVAAQAAADYAYEKSGGTIKIEIYSDSSIGNEPELLEGLQLGTIGMATVAPGNMNEYCQTLKLFLLPYLFENDEHVQRVLESEFGDKILAAVEEDLGFHALAIGQSGFRQTMNTVRPIYTPDDLKNIRIRVPNWPGVISAFETWGAVPQVLAYTEVYTSLSGGVIQGVENPLAVLVSDHFYEVCNYLSITNHVYDCTFFCCSNKAFDKLSSEQQQILKEAFEYASEVSFEFVANEMDSYIKTMEDNGVEVNYIEDYAPFADSIQFIYDDYKDVVDPELIQGILSLK